jgi:hypothetical protein
MKATNEARKAKKPKEDETLSDKVRRHISDKNDVITDEDIRDAKIEEPELPPSPEEENQAPVSEPTSSDQRKENSWDILSEGFD